MRLLLLHDDPVRRHQWQDRAACHDYGSDLFFEPDNELRVVRARREQAAKRVCAACPVRAECLRFAESGPEVFGVWGGTTQRERAVRRRRRKRRAARRPGESASGPARLNA
ncbi:WhiB family transcriptional regulator [Catenulispora subtropica]|uniref:Transcriptional regulator WhiB n=1 Tax=Catenulispora subtropica TaxID=450798 RepID=A0ABN2SII6_9ACTN